MNMVLIRAAAAMAVLVWSPAFAADMPLKVPTTVPPIQDGWNGFYVGVNAGYGWGDANATVTGVGQSIINLGVTGPASAGFDHKGGIAGAQLGYNWKLNPSWVVGVEADIQWSGISGSGSGLLPDPAFVPGGGFNVGVSDDVKWFGTVRGRIGYLATNSILLFATGGLTYDRVERSVSIGNTTGGNFAGQITCPVNVTCFAGNASNTYLGWNVGAGAEFSIARNASVKIEYLYVDLGSKDQFSFATVAPATCNVAPAACILNARFDDRGLNIIRAGLNLHF